MKKIKLCPAILLTGLMLLALFVSPVSVKAACIKLNHKTLCMTVGSTKTLKSDPVVIQIACDRCNEMAKNRVLSHTRPDGSKAWSLLDQRGVVYTYAGENIACTSGYGINTKYATQLWYQSCSHRLTLLSCKYRKMGAGIAVASDGTVYYAQLFTD